MARGLRALGVRRGDRVAALLPNVPEAVIGLLATASIGAIWSSCSPDFGARSVIDRFAQIEPTVLIACDGYGYRGKEFSRAGMVDDVVAALPGLSAVVMVDLIGAADTPSGRFTRWEDLGPECRGMRSARAGQREPEFEEVPFDHPLWVVYSSGTTGLPKPIMHGHGGIVLEHLKALAFHQDLRPGDVFTWYTTTGWMMWNYLAGGLLAGLTIVLYDGSATYPATDRLWRLAAEHGVTYLGVGAPYLVACMKAGLRPGDEADLSALRAIGSTGSPLPPEAFGWVYERVKKDLLLGSFSGGTDLCTGFVGPCPLLPVRAGIISGRCLGAEVEAYDDDGSRSSGRSASWSSPSRCRRCRSVSGTTRAAPGTGRATSTPIPGSGGTATGSSCCPTAGASSTAARTPPSTAAGSGWAPASSTAWWRAFPRSPTAWWWTPAGSAPRAG